MRPALQHLREALLSIYLYNEHRGYTQLEALEAALRRQRPEEEALAAFVHAHAGDERRHYKMFRAWFVRRGVMPLRVGASSGYIDRLVRSVTGQSIDAIDLDAAVRDQDALERLLRLIVLTERRGLTQVHALLGAQRLLLDRELRAMFEVVARDEPSHFEPYAAWLAARGRAASSFRETAADALTHCAIVAWKLPVLVCDTNPKRIAAFPA
jgi:rubrerythrin